MRVEPFLSDVVGMQQDPGRDKLAPGNVWSLLDFNPGISGAALRGRGSWKYISQFTTSPPVGLAWAPYLAGGKLISVTAAADYWDVPTGGSTSILVGSGSVMTKQNPFFYRDKLYLPSDAGACRSLSYTPFVVASLPASALQGRHGTFYRERLVLARSTANPERVAFGKPGDPMLAWDATSFINTSDAVAGLFSLRNQILVFHSAYVEQIRGTTPPDSTLSDPLGDMQLGVLWDRAGCLDARSIAGWQGNVIFADERGIHITDGGLVRNMIVQGGLERLWRATFETGLIADVAGTVFGDHYLCSTRQTDGAGKIWVCHIPTRRWWQWRNIDAVALATSSSAPEKMFANKSGVRRTVDITACMLPDNTIEQVDGNAVNVLPEVETGWQRVSRRVGLRRVYDAFIYYLGWRTTDPGTDLIEVSMVDATEDTTYEVVGGLRQTTVSDRRKLLVARRVEGLALKIRALQPMRDFRIHTIGLSVEAEEEHRVA